MCMITTTNTTFMFFFSSCHDFCVVPVCSLLFTSWLPLIQDFSLKKKSLKYFQFLIETHGSADKK